MKNRVLFRIVILLALASMVLVILFVGCNTKKYEVTLHVDGGSDFVWNAKEETLSSFMRENIANPEEFKAEIYYDEDYKNKVVVSDLTVEQLKEEKCRDLYIRWEVCNHINTSLYSSGISPTCTVQGKSADYKCTECGYIIVGEVIPCIPHSFISYVEVPASCTEVGHIAYKRCKNCELLTDINEKKTLSEKDIVLKRLSHTPSDWIIDKNATCLDDGSRHKQCIVCNILISTEVIPALKHNLQYVDRKEPHCYEPGFESYEYCTRCSYTTYKELTVEHSIVEHAGKTATCLDFGYYPYATCAREGCSYSTYNEIPALGHDEGAWVDADASNVGYQYKVCTRVGCGTVLDVRPKEYSITYDCTYDTDNLNPLSYTIESETFYLTPIEGRKGYEFSHWEYENGDKVEAIVNGTIGDLALIAKWKEKDYTIGYVLNGGSIDGERVDSYSISLIDDLDLPTPKYTADSISLVFDDWFVDAEFTQKFDKAELKDNLRDIILYAKYTQNVCFTVTFYDYNNKVLLINSCPQCNRYYKDSEVDFKKKCPLCEQVLDETNCCDHCSITFDDSEVSWGESICPKCKGDLEQVEEQYVLLNHSAIAPDSPEREGFRFMEWDKGFSNVTENLEIYSKYIQQVTVLFVDYDDTILDFQQIDIDGNAVAPNDPTRQNYRFIGWDQNLDNIKTDLTVKATYIRQYDVTFLDYNGTLLKKEVVDEGGNATAPDNPSKEGFDFVDWDTPFTDVHSDLTVTAIYKIKEYIVKFFMPDGTPLGEQTVQHGFSAIAPELPEVYLDGEGGYVKPYTFTGWDKSFAKVTTSLEIKAEYKTEYMYPVIIVEFSKNRNGDANLYVYSHTSITFNAIEFTIKYKIPTSSVGSIAIKSATFNSSSPLFVESGDGGSNNQFVINNNECIFNFAWADASGKVFNYSSQVITFNFSTDGPVTVSEETFAITGCTCVIGDEEGNNLKKITPIVIYS